MPDKKSQPPAKPAKPNPDASNVIRKGTPPGGIEKVAAPNPKATNIIREGKNG